MVVIKLYIYGHLNKAMVRVGASTVCLDGTVISPKKTCDVVRTRFFTVDCKSLVPPSRAMARANIKIENHLPTHAATKG